MVTILLGPPGAGKGTIASEMSQKYGFKHISTGNILREAIQNQTSLGKKAAVFMDKGELVPDEIMLGLVRKALSQEVLETGVVLDGYPRTLQQAQFLNTVLSEVGANIDLVAYVDVEKEELIRRILGRRTCTNSSCQATYNINYKPPVEEGICNNCHSSLAVRSDETEEIISTRLEEYTRNTFPLLSYYQEQEMLREYQHPDSSILVDRIINDIKSHIEV